MATTTPIDTTAATAWYRRNRARSEAIFDLIDPSAYYSRPISLRNPIVFYEGHLPAFTVLAFLRRGLGLPPVDARLEPLFERGIDPESAASAVPRSGASTVWPSRDEVRAFARACDEAVIAAMSSLSFDSRSLAQDRPFDSRSLAQDRPFDSRSLAQGGAQAAVALEGLYTALEHEAMHQETLLYMWHRLPYEQKRGDQGSGIGDRARGNAAVLADIPASVGISAGTATLGAKRDDVAFGWDNEFDRHEVHVPAFDIDVLPVTNAEFLEFWNAGGYKRRELWSDEGWEWIQAEAVTHPAFWLPAPPASRLPPPASPLAPREWHWRGMFEAIPLPPDWPVYVSHAEASAYARWKGRRLMTEPEWHRAAEGSTSGHFDFAGVEPIPVGSHAPSAAGVYDLVGNGWEWTSTVFAPFAGFVPMRSYPEYSADFFDGRHYVMKGASPATARELVRPSFRNWFRGNYPYVYAKFRTVR